jgi:hypothetical protein
LNRGRIERFDLLPTHLGKPGEYVLHITVIAPPMRDVFCANAQSLHRCPLSFKTSPRRDALARITYQSAMRAHHHADLENVLEHTTRSAR